MRDQQKLSDELFRNLFKESGLEVPFSDLEEAIMQRIQQDAVPEKGLSVDRKLSFFFFIAGTLLGLVLNSILQKLQNLFPGIPSGIAVLFFQLAFALFFLIKLEGFLKLASTKRTA